MTTADEIDQASITADELEEQIAETEENITELKQELSNETDKEQKEWIRNEIQSMRELITELKELLKTQQKTIRDLARQSTKSLESKRPEAVNNTPIQRPESTPPDASDPPQQKQAAKPKAREWI